jgi:hypothetical protein
MMMIALPANTHHHQIHHDSPSIPPKHVLRHVVSEKRCSLGETLPKEPKSHAHTSYSLATSWAVSFSPVVLVEKEVAAARALEEAWDRVGKELRARHFSKDWALGLFLTLEGTVSLLLSLQTWSLMLVLKDCAFGAFRAHARQRER